MWSYARYDLHLSDHDFYALTPRQFDALMKRHRYRTESQEFLFAQLTSWVANTGFKSTDKPMKPTDFMPSQRGKAKPSKSIPRLTRARRKEVVDSLRMLFPRR